MRSSREDTRHRLLSLEAGRFVAAVLVACFHFSFAFVNLRGVPVFGMAFRGGHAGVEFFFVLSGFIIFFIHRGDLGRKGTLGSFAVKRFTRIYPVFWIIWIPLLIGFLAPLGLGGHRVIDAADLVLDGLLLPTDGDGIIQQSWTLRHEVVFYALFAVAIWNLRIGTAVLVAWQGAVLIVGTACSGTLPQALMPFFYIYNIGFGLGIATAWAADRWRPSRPGTIALAGLAFFAACLAAEWYLGRSDYSPTQLPLGGIASPLLYLAASAIVIFGATGFDRRRALPCQDQIRILGGCSYVLYLLHTTVGSVTIRLFGLPILKSVPDGLVFLAMLSASVLVAVGVHLWVEKPVLRFLRGRSSARPPLASALAGRAAE